jgi:hypothetical protein
MDAASLFSMHADVEHMRWYGIEPFTDLAAAETRIKTMIDMRRHRIEAQVHPNNQRSLKL